MPRWPFEDVDELFKEMDELMKREFAEFSRRAPKDLMRERTLPDGTKVKEWGPFVYGYSVTVGPEGKPEVREFGNIKPRAKLGVPGVDIKEQREPLTDVLITDDEVRVVAELPGVEKDDIKLHATEDSLTISVDKPQHRYYKKVKLPAKVEVKQAKSSYKNGVLEVRLQKRKEEQPEGEPINID
jgi:HSP20 family protein